VRSFTPIKYVIKGNTRHQGGQIWMLTRSVVAEGSIDDVAVSNLMIVLIVLVEPRLVAGQQPCRNVSSVTTPRLLALADEL
jgi:hypothetical protein